MYVDTGSTTYIYTAPRHVLPLLSPWVPARPLPPLHSLVQIGQWLTFPFQACRSATIAAEAEENAHFPADLSPAVTAITPTGLGLGLGSVPGLGLKSGLGLGMGSSQNEAARWPRCSASLVSLPARSVEMPLATSRSRSPLPCPSSLSAVVALLALVPKLCRRLASAACRRMLILCRPSRPRPALPASPAGRLACRCYLAVPWLPLHRLALPSIMWQLPSCLAQCLPRPQLRLPSAVRRRAEKRKANP